MGTAEMYILIEELGLKPRTYNVCKAMGISTYGDLCLTSKQDFLKRKGVAGRMVAEIEEKFAGKGYGLKANSIEKPKRKGNLL